MLLSLRYYKLSQILPIRDVQLKSMLNKRMLNKICQQKVVNDYKIFCKKFD